MIGYLPEPRPRRLKTSINKIAQYIMKRIVEIGYSVFISRSKKSKSLYLDVILSDQRSFIVRVSDHASEKTNRWRHKYDIHTTERRRGSMDYIEFLDTFKQIVGEKQPEAASIQPESSPGEE